MHFLKSFRLKAALAIFAVFHLLTANRGSAQIAVNDSISVEVLVNDIFNTDVFVSISNITFNGNSATDLISQQIGYFANGHDAELPLDSGFAITTEIMRTSFLSIWGGGFLEEEEYLDEDVAQILAGTDIHDCAVLEFDAVCAADALAFTYSFVSSEYENFTCTEFNDSFGLFVSGPGISGPYSNGAINIATIPGGDTPVAINTVNGGQPTGAGNWNNCFSANPNFMMDSQYFISNYGYELSQIFFSGWTQALEAFVEVESGQTYHFKFAVCDASDTALNTGVIFEANSFEGRFSSSTENRELQSLTIYPNPAQEMVTLKVPNEFNGGNQVVRIRDHSGRHIRSISTFSKNLIGIPISDLDKGLYVLELLSDESCVGVAKFIRD